MLDKDHSGGLDQEELVEFVRSVTTAESRRGMSEASLAEVQPWSLIIPTLELDASIYLEGDDERRRLPR